jgi:hypothetical protein
MLQKFQRNYIFKAVQTVGLDPAQFIFDYRDTEVLIKHRYSVSYYFIGGRPGNYTVKALVGDGGEQTREFYSWDPLISHISLWLQVLKNDIDTPDLWAELKGDTVLIEGGANKIIDNTFFTPDEQKEIARRLDKMAENVSRVYSLSEAQTQVLREMKAYLIDSSTRLGRKDWLNNFIGVAFPFVLGAALAPEAARALFLMFLRAIGLLYPQLPFEE